MIAGTTGVSICSWRCVVSLRNPIVSDLIRATLGTLVSIQRNVCSAMATLNDRFYLLSGEESGDKCADAHKLPNSTGSKLIVLVDQFPKIGHRRPYTYQTLIRATTQYVSGRIIVTRSFYPLSMSDKRKTLGRCPRCDEQIPPAWALVEYEKDDGSDGVWAECPVCEDVIEPE